MTWDEILVTAIGFGLILFIIKFFWLKGKSGSRLSASSKGVQETLIVVKGGYTPDTVIVKRGVPVRLRFRRDETNSCSEMVLLPAFEKSLSLPKGKEVEMKFTPTEAGEFEFACQMGMLRGKVVVEA